MISSERWIHLNETDSTNNVLLEGEFPPGTIVTADHQTAGRGRMGRAWNDRSGGSFLFSLLVEFPSLSSDAGFLALLAGLCVLEAAENALREIDPDLFAKTEFCLKWPNDVLLSREGHTGKLAGILLESRFERDRFRLVAGIGVNWSGVPTVEGGRFPPVALLPPGFFSRRRPIEFMNWLLPALNRYRYDSGSVSAAIRETIWSRSWVAGRQLRTREGTGIATGLDRDGALMLRGPTGIFRYDRTDEEYEVL